MEDSEKREYVGKNAAIWLGIATICYFIAFVYPLLGGDYDTDTIFDVFDLFEELESNLLINVLALGGFIFAFFKLAGGFQVFSLSDRRKLTEEGAHFRSHIDGSKHLFTPEGVVDIERTIGADIMMALDECPPGMADYAYAKKSLGLTHRWLERGWKRYKETEGLYGYSQAYFPIVQGVRFADLRRESAKFVSDFGADGNAIGGLAVGEPTEVMYEMIEVVNEILPADKPRYLMGVGTPANILEAIDRGVDMMDCVMPTRNGRNGMLFTANGVMNMRNKKWSDDFSPIDPDGPSYVDRAYSKAYLRHLFISQELLAMQIASIHNLAFYLWLVGEARQHILEGDFPHWKTDMTERVTRRL